VKFAIGINEIDYFWCPGNERERRGVGGRKVKFAIGINEIDYFYLIFISLKQKNA